MCTLYPTVLPWTGLCGGVVTSNRTSHRWTRTRAKTYRVSGEYHHNSTEGLAYLACRWGSSPVATLGIKKV